MPYFPFNRFGLVRGSVIISNSSLIEEQLGLAIGTPIVIGFDGEYVRTGRYSWSIRQLEREIEAGHWTISETRFDSTKGPMPIIFQYFVDGQLSHERENRFETAVYMAADFIRLSVQTTSEFIEVAGDLLSDVRKACFDGIRETVGLQEWDGDGIHPSHSVRFSDASSFDYICTKCCGTDNPLGLRGVGPWGDLAKPCPRA